MFFKFFILLIISLFFVVSCGLKQPEINPKSEFAVGSVYVNSNIIGARIFVNSDTTGKVTPDTIKNIPVGTAIIQVFKDGYLINPDSILVNVSSDSISSVFFALEYITNQGKLFVNSTPGGAKIIVDNNISGKFTPDTVIVAAGLHQLALYKNGFDSLDIGELDVATNSLTLFDEVLIVEKQVLIESFANSSCLPCTTTNTHLENFMSAFNENEYSLIEYFTNWPNPFDPMFQHNIAGNTARFTYYNIRSVPSMFIAGTTVDATDYDNIVNTFTSELSNVKKDVSLSLSSQVSDSIKVKVESIQFNALPTADWRLFVAVIEKELVFAEPPGANGLSTFKQVFRKFLTPDDGDTFTFSNNRFEKTYTGSISAEWDLNEIQIVGFIQNRDTKKVIKSSHL